MQADYPNIILASASAARASILGNAGLAFNQQPSVLDEKAEHLLLNGTRPPADVALHLARQKADLVTARNPDALIIGADQVLAIGDAVFQKPASAQEAREQLISLRGRSHRLYSAAVILYKGEARAFADTATLTMREFSDDFLDWYLETASESVLTSVGAYHLEGLGIHLFSKIEGDYFTILGLPILPVLAELRRLGVVLENPAP